METLYLIIVVFLFVLAIFDLMVGVSNDAVNFLNSAVGSKAASFKLVLFIAAIGIFIGAALSNGMMDIARHGIYQPQHFYFAEIMCILLAVMLTDVVLLDVFNSMGMPTSTTVSMVFELLGGTFALAIMKASKDSTLGFGDLINTDKALSVVMGIFLSVAIAFFFGWLVQWLARLIFSFNYKSKMKYTIGIFGGIAATSIIYFMLIKGLKDSAFMTIETKQWIQTYTWQIVGVFFIFFTFLMQTLHLLKINVFKVIVLMGTFALALAFAGNDLVNFIGVPLAGYSSYVDLVSQPGATPDTLLMTSLLGSAKTPWYFLVGAGAIMVFALCTSKKAHNVIKTSVNLSRQDEGEEVFGSTPAARTLVRVSLNMSNSIMRVVPMPVKTWIDTRFRKDEAIIEDGAAFDLIRASVNLVLAGLLIAIGTSLKLPLSTTYVTFMVAMGSSLADRAWGRDSAVYRITGVLSVIGGWFLTAGLAFSICFIVTLILNWGGFIAGVALVLIAVFSLVRSQIVYKKKQKTGETSPLVTQLIKSDNADEVLTLLKQHTNEELSKVFTYAENNFALTVNSFMDESLRGLRKATGAIKFEKSQIKQMKRIGTVAMSHTGSNIILDKGLYYYQSCDFSTELMNSLGKNCEVCLEHISNNFNPLSKAQKEEFAKVSGEVSQFINGCKTVIEQNDYTDLPTCISISNHLNSELSRLKREELTRIQNQSNSIKVSLMYLTVLQETQSIVNSSINILKVNRKFQQ